MGWLGGRGKGERNHTHRLKGCGDAGGRERRGERARRRRRDAWPLSTAAVETSRSPPTKTRADAPARAQTSACGHLSCERGPGAPSLSTRTSEDDERGHEFHCFWPGADGHSRGGGGGRRARAHTHGARRESERETVGEKLRKRGGMVGPRFLEGSGVRVCAEEEGLVGCYGRGGQVGGCTERVRRWLSKWSVGCECEAGVSEKGRRAGAWGGGRGRRRGEG